MTARLPERIAIDGPVGSGKSSVGRRVARRLGYRFLDTGLMYRAVTRAALDRGVALDDERALAEIARDRNIGIRFDGAGEASVVIDGEDVTDRLRTPAVDRGVPTVSAVSPVREVLVRRQQAIAAESPVIMVGRDIGTVVLADAELKVYLTASVEERANRRFLELKQAGVDISYEAVLESLRRRDDIDTSRADSPLRPARDSRLVDSDGLSLEAVVDRVAELAERAS